MRFSVTKALSAFLVGCALLTGLADAMARDVVISFKDGRTIQGEFVSEDNDTVVIAISTIKTSYNKKDIKSVQTLLTVEEEYQQKKKALKAGDVEGWYNLSYWLYSQKAYKQALTEIDGLLAAFSKPGSLKPEESSYLDRAKILRGLVNAEIAKTTGETKAPPVKPTTGTTPATQPTNTAAGAMGVQQQYTDRRMTDAQLNMIRVYEIGNPLVEKPRVQIKKEALDSFISTYNDKPSGIRTKEERDAFMRAPAWFQLSMLFDNKARELYPSVTVFDDPPVMLTFKKNIHSNYIMNYCGTSNCHGGAEAGNLFFFTLDPSSSRTVYSNFFNLYTWQDPTGYMINMNNPTDSYLVQYGQPIDMKRATFMAKKAHPNVKGWAPKFLTLGDPLQRTIEEWILTLGTTRSDFGIDYVPPVVSPGAKPAQRTFSPPPPIAPAPEEPKKAVPR